MKPVKESRLRSTRSSGDLRTPLAFAEERLKALGNRSEEMGLTPASPPWRTRRVCPSAFFAASTYSPGALGLLLALVAAAILPFGEAAAAAAATVDPVTRHIHVAYSVPADAPDEVTVLCSWAPHGTDSWKPAKVMPLISETALGFLDSAVWDAGVKNGQITERRAAGLTRTVVFNPYPEAQTDGVVDADFRIEVRGTDGKSLATHTVRIEVDNSDVVYVEDWSKILQHHALAVDGEADTAKWTWRTDLSEEEGASLGNGFYGNAGPETGLPQVSYPLDLRNTYAIHVCTVPGKGSVRMRLSGDERTDRLSSRFAGQEVLWRWTRMDRQHLVIKQPYAYTGYTPGHIDYVKLVPLTDEQRAKLDAPFEAEADKIAAGYWEPYSYAFSDNVQDTAWHREYLTAYKEARIGLVDMQLGRFGARMVYESRMASQLLYATRGDPIGKVKHPQTDNVGRMQQYTNTLDASLRAAKDLGFALHANYGATNCYPGSPLQGEFSKAHPEWMRGSALRYEVPEVRTHILSIYREALEVGARGLSIDFCRYPEGIDKVETCNAFFAELRALADEFGQGPQGRVPILVRFPATGVRRSEMFDYATWAHEGWVDYLCPSNIQGRHLHIDPVPYLRAVQGTASQVLPCLDGLSWGQTFVEPFLWQVDQLYRAGAPGVYVYQADARVLGQPAHRRCMRLLTSSTAIRGWLHKEEELRTTRSKGIYITPPLRVEGYSKWHRLRVWTEGVPLGEVEVYLDGELRNRFDGPPYLLGEEDYASDGVLPAGERQVKVRARDGEGWLEQTFTITSAG